jgi:hypothetical protein
MRHCDLLFTRNFKRTSKSEQTSSRIWEDSNKPVTSSTNAQSESGRYNNMRIMINMTSEGMLSVGRYVSSIKAVFSAILTFFYTLHNMKDEYNGQKHNPGRVNTEDKLSFIHICITCRRNSAFHYEGC